MQIRLENGLERKICNYVCRSPHSERDNSWNRKIKCESNSNYHNLCLPPSRTNFSCTSTSERPLQCTNPFTFLENSKPSRFRHKTEHFQNHKVDYDDFGPKIHFFRRNSEISSKRKIHENLLKIQKHKVNDLFFNSFLKFIFHFQRNFWNLHWKSLTNREILTKQMKNQRSFRMSLFSENLKNTREMTCSLLSENSWKSREHWYFFIKETHKMNQNENHKINAVIFRKERYSKTQEYSLILRLGKNSW